MNVQNYIDSGAIEAYVLGLMNAGEAAEMRRLMEADEAVRQAVETSSDALEEILMAGEKQPPPELENIILNRLRTEGLIMLDNMDDADNNSTVQKVAENISGIFTPDMRIVHSRRSPQWLRYASSILLLMLLASLWANVFWYRKHSQVLAIYNTMLVSNQQMAANSQQMQVKFRQMEQHMEALGDPSTQAIRLVGQAGYEQQQATVYMNYRTRKLMLIQNNLPPLPKDQVYQLWAIVNGKPVSAGLLDNCQNKICNMKPILGNVAAYAISIEKAGPEQEAPGGVINAMGSVI